MMSEYFRDRGLAEIQEHFKKLDSMGVIVDLHTVQLDESYYWEYFGYRCHHKQNMAGHVSIDYNGVTYTAYVGPNVSKYKVIDKDTPLE